MDDGPESQTYTRLRRDALAAHAAKTARPNGAKRIVIALIVVAALVAGAWALGLFGGGPA
ncbi:MAG: hypothetical protein H6835_16660 [Planctomycetes bacterium]|nr:hypothetical protein [Planctomycetota bacterium]